MIDAIETITEAIPCNIVYGRRQAAEGIARALSAAGFTIMSKEDVEAVREEAVAEYKAAIDSLKNVTDADLERVRDKALEEAAVLTEAGREVPDPSDNYRSTTMEDWEDMIELAAAILSLKSIPHKE